MIHNDLSTRKGKAMSFAKMYMVSFFIPICKLAGSTMMVWIIQIWIDTGNRLDFLTNTNSFNIDEAMNLLRCFGQVGAAEMLYRSISISREFIDTNPGAILQNLIDQVRVKLRNLPTILFTLCSYGISIRPVQIKTLHL
jgi:hypothetical protein